MGFELFICTTRQTFSLMKERDASCTQHQYNDYTTMSEIQSRNCPHILSPRCMF